MNRLTRDILIALFVAGVAGSFIGVVIMLFLQHVGEKLIGK